MAEITIVERFLGLMSEPGMSAKIAAAQRKADADGRLNERRKIVALKAADAKEAETILPQLSHAVDAAKERAEAAKKAYDAALDEFRSATGALLSASGKFERQRERFDAQLLDDGDPAGRIKRFLEDLDVMWALERRLPCRSEMRATGEFFKVTGQAVTKPWSDRLSRARLLAAIRQAQVSAKLLMLEALTADEIEARLRALAEALPEVQLEDVSIAA